MALDIISKKKDNAADGPLIIAGPCTVENFEVMDKSAKLLSELGVKYIRGGAFKPRTSPYSFQGLGRDGLDILKEIKEKYSLKIVSEIMDARDVEYALDIVDVIQIGSRNMYNYTLLKEVGKVKNTILLKRGISATLDEWLNAAEYIALEGNEDIIMCERGIRTFETYTRNTLDLSCIPAIKEKTGLKVIIDPSHGTGVRNMVNPMSRASIAAGADGLIIEMHPNPSEAVCDGEQSVNLEQFTDIYNDVVKLYNFIRD
ncbi:MAG: 3-deoxy-7-phosphoheptulonate synthase [Clostridium sp.]|uniref:3-deoxy-7-phosphoheptulonate synthase n=1 Tax=Clostridium sp. TaxID=1506 RepID=UPI002FCA2BB7